jgi:DNA-binding NarL/FixJ family response regulator
MMINLLLVDDQILIRRGMKALLKSAPDLQVVGEAGNGQEAIALIKNLCTMETPLDVVLMDVRMPVMDGVTAIKVIGQQFPAIKVLVLTTFDDEDYVREALQVGAAGYLLKDTPFEELTQAIHLACKGYTQIAPGLASKAIANHRTSQSHDVLPTEWQQLTPREQEILQCIAQGFSNREIAQELYICEKTVRNHVTNILSQLNLRDRTQAAIFVHAHNISTKMKTITRYS